MFPTVFLALVLVALLVFIYLLVTRRPAQTPSPFLSKGSVKAAATADIEDDDEATQVRVAGPRIVRIVNSLKVGDEISIARGITVGQGQKCSLRLNDPELADVHAEFRLVDRVAVVADLGQKPTFVNDRQVIAHAVTSLKSGDHVRVGTTLFQFMT